MKKKTFFLFLFVSILANAQTFTLKGKVVDENKNPLPGASILVQEIKKGTFTDDEGNFSLKINQGKYKIKVSHLGYKTGYFDQEINQDEEIVLQLILSQYVLEEVLVSAVRVNAEAPVTHSNLSKKEISKRNLGQDIPMLLNYLPSVISSSDAGAGVGYTYLAVDTDKEWINFVNIKIDSLRTKLIWVNLGDFASSTQNLQLQRGVGTSTNGSGAFGASLNILTDAISEEAGGEISNSFGSFGTRKHTTKFTTGSRKYQQVGTGSGVIISSDGYIVTNNHVIDGASELEITLNNRKKYKAFGGAERTYQAWYGLDPQQLEEDRRQNPYTYENEVDDYKQNHYQLHWNEKLNNHWSTNLGLNYTKGAGFFEQFKEDEDAADFNNLIIDGTDVIVRRWLDNDFYVANFNATYTNEGIEIIGGISYSNYTNDHFGEVIWGSDLSDER